MKEKWNRGSEWHRWDPHIHTPGTLFNNQFKGDWQGFLKAVENSTPKVEALGITDYCVLDGYKKFHEYWEAGRAQNVKFIFPNIEFRLGIETERKKGVNIHLLFSPEDPDHITNIERALGHLVFNYKGVDYSCIPKDLIKLGYVFDSSIKTSEAALTKGAEQFKVELSDIRKMLNNDAWAKKNSLVAVVTNSTDGTGGLSKDGSFDATQEEIKGLADIIFSAFPSDREFWLGKKTGFSSDVIERDYRSLKPCLHGSDAHAIAEVLQPDDNRYCWIRAELSFTGLKQILLEPDLRTAIGQEIPASPAASECIKKILVTNAPWLKNQEIELNDGLVTIIGPKGSGKTALADMIAHAAGAAIEEGPSFLLKAKEYLESATVELHWADGSKTEPSILTDAGSVPPRTKPEVRYLSQQFVERLCSSDDLGQELLTEIESVVFDAIPNEERLEAINFDDLSHIKLEQTQRMRSTYLDSITRFTEVVAKEDENKLKIPIKEKYLAGLKIKIAKDQKDLTVLLPKNKKNELEKLGKIQSALDTKTKEIQRLQVCLKNVQELQKEYAQTRDTWSQEFDDLKERYKSCALTEEEWLVLSPTFESASTQQKTFEKAKLKFEAELKSLNEGTAPQTDPDLSKWPLADLQSSRQSLSLIIGIENDRAKKYTVLARRISDTEQESEKLNKELSELQLSGDRRKKAIDERRKAYTSVFSTFVDEQTILEGLYSPLKTQLAQESGVEKRFEFYVRRKVDLDSWVKHGETLLDLRKSGAFHGRGTLENIAKEGLLGAWQSGSADNVADAMENFITKHMASLMAVKLPEVPLQDLGRWLFSTAHIDLEYGIKYDGVDISRLSPGMRGIVLLMLYLAVDQWDTRPLLVDQPEENLDPHSVYEELVKYFRISKRRRQVILVTHNANLVVNADADQVIVASSLRKDPRSLPTISYISGGLEDKIIRAEVCRILEGGERAFLDRERRYALPQDPRIGT
jgi:energy-coupling factor transporter ATP-binding protein EcfA2